MDIGYGRVSTDRQDALLQRQALIQVGCQPDHIFEEKISSRKKDRPELAAAIRIAREGDTFCIWKIDRLARSTKEILVIADALYEKGVGLRILTGKLSGNYSPTGEGKFFFTMMAAFAELERDMTHERTMAGLAAARTHGRIGGRPPALTQDQIDIGKARIDRGESAPQVAAALGVSRNTVYRHIK